MKNPDNMKKSTRKREIAKSIVLGKDIIKSNDVLKCEGYPCNTTTNYIQKTTVAEYQIAVFKKGDYKHCCVDQLKHVGVTYSPIPFPPTKLRGVTEQNTLNSMSLLPQK